jgi:soluble cytochrome b562
MKIPHLLTVLLLASWGLLHAEEGGEALEGQMKILARGSRQLSQQITDPAQQQGTIDLLEKLRKAALDSKAINPRKTVEVPQADQAKFLADYRTDLDELADAFNQVEEAVKAGQYDKAKSLLATVNSIKKEGHAKFKAD